MPSFAPTRNYLLRLTQGLIDRFRLEGPFLEIGCGDGAVSLALARRGWSGAALDLSEEAVAMTSCRLAAERCHDSVRVIRGDFMECQFDQRFRTIVLYDVLEHVAEDRAFMRKIRSCLVDGGFVLLSVPIKMAEWRWDDDGYGHLRRYEPDELAEIFDSNQEGFERLVEWDITFPVLWMLRRIYMAACSAPQQLCEKPVTERTRESAFVNAGGQSRIVRVAESMPIWPALFWLQDRFRSKRYGCNNLILARAIHSRT